MPAKYKEMDLIYGNNTIYNMSKTVSKTVKSTYNERCVLLLCREVENIIDRNKRSNMCRDIQSF